MTYTTRMGQQYILKVTMSPIIVTDLQPHQRKDTEVQCGERMLLLGNLQDNYFFSYPKYKAIARLP